MMMTEFSIWRIGDLDIVHGLRQSWETGVNRRIAAPVRIALGVAIVVSIVSFRIAAAAIVSIEGKGTYGFPQREFGGHRAQK